jgi:hypothetical protein
VGPISIGERRWVIVVRVGQSLVAPHRVIANNIFYGRHSSGKYPLDVGELRTAFTQSEAIPDRIRTFRVERLLKIQAGETPLPMVVGAKAILHLVPLSAMSGRMAIDVNAIKVSWIICVLLCLEAITHG